MRVFDSLRNLVYNSLSYITAKISTKWKPTRTWHLCITQMLLLSRFDLLTIWILCSGNHCIFTLRSPLYYRISYLNKFFVAYFQQFGYFEWSFSIISVCIIRICISIFHMIYFPEQQKNTSQQNWYSVLPAEIPTSFWG